jgi:hypothetical protein
MQFGAPTWHTALEIVRRIERGMRPQPPSPPDPESLAKLAAEFQRQAPEMLGEMPFEVEAFIRRYGTP